MALRVPLRMVNFTTPLVQKGLTSPAQDGVPRGDATLGKLQTVNSGGIPPPIHKTLRHESIGFSASAVRLSAIPRVFKIRHDVAIQNFMNLIDLLMTQVGNIRSSRGAAGKAQVP